MRESPGTAAQPARDHLQVLWAAWQVAADIPDVLLALQNRALATYGSATHRELWPPSLSTSEFRWTRQAQLRTVSFTFPSYFQLPLCNAALQPHLNTRALAVTHGLMQSWAAGRDFPGPVCPATFLFPFSFSLSFFLSHSLSSFLFFFLSLSFSLPFSFFTDKQLLSMLAFNPVASSRCWPDTNNSKVLQCFWERGWRSQEEGEKLQAFPQCYLKYPI